MIKKCDNNTKFLPSSFANFKKAMNFYVNSKLKNTNITSIHVMYIKYLSINEQQAQAQITKDLGYDKANSSRVLAELETKELVLKRVEENKAYYSLSEEGKKLANKIEKIFKSWEAKMIEGLSCEELKSFFETAGKIMQNCKNTYKEMKEENKK